MKKALPLFLVSLLFLMFSCKEDDFQHSNDEHEKTEKKQISFREFLNLAGNKPEVQQIKKYFQGADNGIFERGEDSINWEIDTTQITQIILPEITTYTFGVIEHDAVEGFRNVIIKQTDAETKAYLVHYPQGVDFEGHTPAQVYVEEIDESIMMGRIKSTCYIMVYSCLACGSDTCNFAPSWNVQEVTCPPDNSGGGGGGDDDPYDPFGDDGQGDLPTDPTPGGSGGSGDNNPNQTPCQSLTLKIMQHNFQSKLSDLRSKLSLAYETGHANYNPNERVPAGNGTNAYEAMIPVTNAKGLPALKAENLGPDVFGFMHTHPITSEFMGVHSVGDIKSFMNLLRRREANGYSLQDTYSIVVGNHGTYSIKLEDFDKFNAWQLQFGYSGEDRIKYNKYFEKMEKEYKKINEHPNTREENEKAILKLLGMYYSDLGVGIYRRSDDRLGWDRMTLDDNGKPKLTPCN